MKKILRASKPQYLTYDELSWISSNQRISSNEICLKSYFKYYGHTNALHNRQPNILPINMRIGCQTINKRCST